MKKIIKSIIFLSVFIYGSIAFLFMISEGTNQEPTIYNFIGLAMFALPLMLNKIIKPQTK